MKRVGYQSLQTQGQPGMTPALVQRQSRIPSPPQPHATAERPAKVHFSYPTSASSFVCQKFMLIAGERDSQGTQGTQFMV